jgi:hypothetical protein
MRGIYTYMGRFKAGSREQGAGSREHRAQSREQGAGSREQGAWSTEHRARSTEQGAQGTGHRAQGAGNGIQRMILPLSREIVLVAYFAAKGSCETRTMVPLFL